MKTLTKFMLGLGILGLSSLSLSAQSSTNIEQTFVKPADQQTSCYWYWLSGNVSKQGVISDLKAMKQQGINRAFIGFQGLDGIPVGPVKFRSDEWWDIVHTALKTATELGIEIGIFNGPGWSHMGGEWVKPEESMRYLASQRVQVDGGKQVSLSFKHPDNFLSNVKVLAFKNKIQTIDLTKANAEVTTDAFKNVDAVLDGNAATASGIKDGTSTITFKPNDANFVLRSVLITQNNPLSCQVEVAVKNDGQWKTVKTFNINRTNLANNVGYDIFAPVAEGIADAKAQEVKLTFKNVNKNAELREVKVSSEPVVSRYAEKILSRMHQTPLPYWHDYKWATEQNYKADEVVAAADVLDITSSLNGDELNWNAPAGNWTIVRTYMAPTGINCSPALPGEGKGLEVDRWNRTALKNHYENFMGAIRDHVPAADRKSWKVVVCDSYETATQNFGDDFFEYFQSHFGYDPTPYLLTYSGIVVENSALSERFLWDLRRMIADRLSYDNIGAMNEIAQKDGMHTWLESYGHWGFPGEFLQYGSRSGEVGGEFWSEGSLGDIENRAGSSVGHIYGKGKVSAESFTAGGPEYSRSPYNFKLRGDRFFTEGINNTLLHFVVASKNEDRIPDIMAGFGNEFNRKNSWYSDLNLFNDYVKRCNAMLQNGNYVADILYFIGEDAPVMTGLVEPACPFGLQYDFVNADVIENTLSASADHTLSLPYGNKYKLLVLPPSKTMRPEVLKAIKKLVENGAIVLGPRPEWSPSMQNYPACDTEIKALADELWGKEKSATSTMNKVGQGYVLNGYTIEQVYDLFGIKNDFQVMGATDVKYCHVSKDGFDTYFIANQGEKTIEFNAQMRIAGKQPELWQAVDGTMRTLKSYQVLNGTTTVPMRLQPHESAFLVFRTAGQGGTTLNVDDNFPRSTEIATVSAPWKVQFSTNYGFKKAVTMNELKDWTTFDDANIKYMGGHGTYTSTVNIKNIPAGKKITLDLGKVNNICTVKVNGKELGGVWTYPYTVDITSAVKAGKNTIEIDVANNLYNRFVGDKADPEHAVLKSNINTRSADTKLQPSGLVGPVRVMAEK